MFPLIKPSLLLALLPAFALAPLCAAQNGSAALREAYFLDRQLAQPEQALALYRQALADPNLDAKERELARGRIAALEEDLASAELARLAPPETLLYVELNAPGVHLASLGEGLDLFAANGLELPDGRRLQLRPELLEGLMGIRGAALAVTRIDPSGQRPQGLLVVHPGDHELARSLLLAALTAAGSPAEAIRGRAVQQLEGGYFAAVSERLVFVASSRRELTQALRRLDGDLGPGLAADERLAAKLAARQGSLFSVRVNGAGLAPMLDVMLAGAAQHDPQAALARELLDPRSLEDLGLTLFAGEGGLRLEAELGLRADHRALGFELLRTAKLDRAALAAIPAGAAGYLALGWNEAGSGSGAPAGRTGFGLLDLGRELFANLDTLAFFGLPQEGGGPAGLPHGALVLVVDDAERSREVWNTCLGLASLAGGTAMSSAGSPIVLAGIEGRTHQLPDMPPLHVLIQGRHVLISPSPLALEAAVATLSGSASVLDDAVLGAASRELPEHTSLAMLLHPGRICELVAPFSAPHETRVLHSLASALRETRAGLSLEHGPNRLAVRISLAGLPRMDALLAAVRAEERTGALQVPAPSEAANVGAGAR